MKFLEDLGFSKEYINELYDDVPENILLAIEKNKKLVSANINYLRSLGIPNYVNIFIRYYDMFLMDNSNFMQIFDKYEKDDLIKKLSTNINIVEFL